MGKGCKFKKKKLGMIIASVGVGVIITVIIPFWGWLFAVGAGLIYIGWYFMNQYHN